MTALSATLTPLYVTQPATTARPPGGVGQHLVLTLRGAPRPDATRAPLDLTACVDVSGSMEGAKLEMVTATLERLGRELTARDRLSVVTFSDEARVRLPPTLMDDSGRGGLRATLEALEAGGSTAMAEGLTQALRLMHEAPAPSTNAVRRVLLFTDGHANRGLSEGDREGWAALLAAETRGLSVSCFGYGGDHDPLFLAWLADQAKGNAWAVRNEDAIADAFARELGGLLGMVAVEVEVRVDCPRGALSLLNDERHERDGQGLVVHLADLAAEEQRTLVLAWEGPRLRSLDALPFTARLRWTEVLTREAQGLALECAVPLAEAWGPADAQAKDAVVRQRVAALQALAQEKAEAGDFPGAVRHVREALALLEEHRSEATARLRPVLLELAEHLANAAAYRDHRANVTSTRRSMGKQKPSGSDLDIEYSTRAQHALAGDFKATVVRKPRG